MDDDNDAQAAQSPPPKRPYRPPAIESAETYERLALACTGSFNDMFMGCLLPKNSGGMLMCNIACQGS